MPSVHIVEGKNKEKVVHQKYNCKRGVVEHEPITMPHGQEGCYYVVATLRACIHTGTKLPVYEITAAPSY